MGKGTYQMNNKLRMHLASVIKKQIKKIELPSGIISRKVKRQNCFSIKWGVISKSDNY
jgi:hypothetical protein